MRRLVPLTLMVALASVCARADPLGGWEGAKQAYREGRWADAVRFFEECRSASPGDAAIAKWLGAALLRLGRGSDALLVLEPVVRDDPRNAEVLTNIGLAWRLAGSDRSAEEALQRALAADPSFTPARSNLAALLLSANRRAEAEALWRERLAVAPSDVGARLGLAAVLESQSKYDEALAELRAVEGDAAAAATARLLVLTGDIEGGLQTFAGIADPQVAALERFCGALTSRQAAESAATRLADPSVRNRLSAYGLGVLAQALASLQRWDELRPVLEDLTKTTEFQARWRPTEKAPVYAHLAFIAARAGDPATARAFAEAALTLDPAEPLARHIAAGQAPADPLVALERAARQPTATIEDLKAYAVLAAGTPDYVPPEPALQVLLGIGTQDPGLLGRLGVILLRAGRFREAADKLSQAVALTSGDAALRNNLGVAYEALGRKSDAEREYAQAVRADPGSREAQANLRRVRSGGGV